MKKGVVNPSKFNRQICVVLELIKRHYLNLWLNPGVLCLRFVMYKMLSLVIGLFFFDLGVRARFTSIYLRASLMFYSFALLIFMVVSVVPFLVQDNTIAAKEIFHGYYHPVVRQFAMFLANVPCVFILSLVVLASIVPILKFRAPVYLFVNMFLALLCYESISQMVSHLVNNYILGIVVLAMVS